MNFLMFPGPSHIQDLFIYKQGSSCFTMKCLENVPNSVYFCRAPLELASNASRGHSDYHTSQGSNIFHALASYAPPLITDCKPLKHKGSEF